MRKKHLGGFICEHVKHNYCQIWKKSEISNGENLVPSEIIVGNTTNIETPLFSTPGYRPNVPDVSELFLSPNTTISMIMPEFSEGSSGSGAGPPGLDRATISRQINLLEIKGRGR